MTQLFSYNFATVENPLSDGGNFTEINDPIWASPATALEVYSGSLCAPTVASSWCGAIYSAQKMPADQYGEITLTHWVGGSASENFFIWVRATSATAQTYYYVQVGNNAGNPTFNIGAIVSGTSHSLVAATNCSPAQGDVWRLSVAGNVLTLTQNGTARSTFTDTNNYVTGAGYVGLGLYSVNVPVQTTIATSLFAGGGTVITPMSPSTMNSAWTLSSSNTEDYFQMWNANMTHFIGGIDFNGKWMLVNGGAGNSSPASSTQQILRGDGVNDFVQWVSPSGNIIATINAAGTFTFGANPTPQCFKKFYVSPNTENLLQLQNSLGAVIGWIDNAGNQNGTL